MEKKFMRDSISHYQEIIDYYRNEIEQNNNLINGDTISEKRKHGLKMLNKIMELEIEKCKNNIERLLNE